MPTMKEVRAKFPQYNDLTDQQLAGALHRKFYADMPFKDFAAKVGLLQPEIATAGKGDRERSWSEYGMDALKSAGAGLVEGTIGLASMPQDLGTWLGDKVGYGISRIAGRSPEEAQADTERVNQIRGQSGLRPPSSREMTQAYESTFGPMYQPQTVIGQYARTVGEFAPTAVAGPGSWARKTALSVVPAVASETGGQLTEGTALEPFARVGGALLGGIAAAERGNAGTKIMLKDVGDSGKAYKRVEASTNKAYNDLRAAGVRYDANAVDQAIADVSNMRINPNLAPKAVGLRDELAKFAGQGMDFQDLDEMERLATGILRHHATDPTEKKFVGDILSKVKEIRTSGAIATNGTVSAGEVNALIGTAKDLARRRIIGRDINKMKDKSEWYLSGPESGLRNQFKNYGTKNYQNLTPAEDKAFKTVMNREGILNPLHTAGSRVGQAILGGAGLSVGGIPGAIASTIGAAAARKFMEVYTMKGVDEALKTVLAGKSAQQRAAVLDKLSRGRGRLQGLLTTDAGRRSAQDTFLTDAQGREYPYPSKSLLGQ